MRIPLLARKKFRLYRKRFEEKLSELHQQFVEEQKLQDATAAGETSRPPTPRPDPRVKDEVIEQPGEESSLREGPIERSRVQSDSGPEAGAAVDVCEPLADGETNFTAVLLSLPEFMTNDIVREAYLTDQTVDMVVSAGELLAKGWDDPDMLQKSLEFFKIAALEGCVTAARFVGLFYKTGLATEKDLVVARKWLQLAASGSDAVACFVLGQMEEHGEGGTTDADGARKLYDAFNIHRRGAGAQSAAMLAKFTPRPWPCL